jgi:hypothetical protein
VPKAPQKETPLLLFPKSGKNIFEWKVIRDIRPSVLIFVQFTRQNIKQANYDTKCTQSMKKETVPPQLKPSCIRGIGFLSGSDEVRKCGKEGCHEGKHHEEMANLARK